MKNWRKSAATLAAITSTLVAFPALATPSPVRFKGETFRAALKRNAPVRGWARGSATTVATKFDDADWSRVPSLSKDRQRTFETVRDRRFLDDASHPDFLRRASWLYPPDGCYARAASVVATADSAGFERPAQLFAFGDLRVETPNVAEGQVEWWYHVTAVYRAADGQIYAFDPALDPKHPMPVQQWLLKMVPKLDDVTVAVCTAEASEPNVDCADGESGEVEQMLEVLRTDFLPAEWDNLASMGRAPERELGDFPPWLTPTLRRK